MLSKRRKSSVVNGRNVQKIKSSNIGGGNDLNTIGEKDLMEHIKEKYHSLSDSEKLPFIKINDNKGYEKGNKQKIYMYVVACHFLW
ncbi:hypothetical protein ACJIZ3_009008 [Penstemon smallii]|uniref:Uncharacterized protein n=1 Tax=Penstemon smallii TaxID=265156 RepID=A0ABD3TBB7_9LAMI